MSDRREFRDLATPEEAHAVVESLDVDPGTETVPLEEARDRVLAERIDAAIDVPGFDRASMDGYAVRARDTFGAGEGTPELLAHAGTVHAGEEPAVAVDSGEAVEISTGAVMPDGADAVVMVERTTETDGGVEIRTAVTPGENVMLAGADIAAGARALGPGTRLTPREVGLLSALGVDEVPVRARPRVGHRLDRRRTRPSGRGTGQRRRSDIRRQQLQYRGGRRGGGRGAGPLPPRGRRLRGDGTAVTRGRRRV